MEQELIESYKRNMAKHSQQELKEGFKWEMWQAQKLKDLKEYRKEAKIIIDKHSKRAKEESTGELWSSFSKGVNTVDAVTKSIRKTVADDSFFRMNRLKVNSLVDAVNNDFGVANVAALRLVDDKYRQVIFKSQLMYAAGAKTLPQAIDMAANDFLHAGINCIQYKNGAKVNIASYCEATLRASSKKSYLTGEGSRMADMGLSLVQVTSYGGCSDTCLPWQGKVYVDDVYAGGNPDGKHPLLSTAMAEGLYHPNCRHTHGPWFEGISYEPVELDREKIRATYLAEQRQHEIERKIREWKRVQEGSIDPLNQQRAGLKVKAWQNEMRTHLEKNSFLSRKPYREKTYGIPYKPDKFEVKVVSAKRVDETFHEDWSKGLVGDEITSLYKYSGGEYEDINNYLRGVDKKPSQEIKKYAENAVSALNKASLHEDMSLTRGTSKEALQKLIGKDVDKLIKKRDYSSLIVSDKGIMSTTKDINTSKDYSDKVHMEIFLHKGTKAGDISDLLKTDGSEIAIAPGVNFRIVSLRKNRDGDILVSLRTIPKR